MREQDESPRMEARSHSADFLRKAARLAEEKRTGAGSRRHRGTRKQTREYQARAARRAASRVASRRASSRRSAR